MQAIGTFGKLPPRSTNAHLFSYDHKLDGYVYYAVCYRRMLATHLSANILANKDKY